MNPFKSFSILNGTIMPGPRPKHAEIKSLKKKINKVVTLLWETEDPNHIENDCESFGITWKWVPIKAINWETYSNSQNKTRILQGLEDTLTDLSEGRSVLIHCAAGIHRTGFFVYNLLRMSGFGVSEAKEAFNSFRPEILRRFGRLRFEVSENFFQSTKDCPIFTPFYETLDLFQSDFISKKQDFLLWVKIFQNDSIVKIQFSATAKDFSKIVVGGEVFLKTFKNYSWRRQLELPESAEIKIRSAEEVQQLLISFILTSQFRSKVYLAGFGSKLDREFIRDHFPELDDMLEDESKFKNKSKYQNSINKSLQFNDLGQEKPTESIYDDIKCVKSRVYNYS